MPISAPSPNSPPSVNRVEALTYTAAFSYTLDTLDSTQRSRFADFLQKDLKRVSTNLSPDGITEEALLEQMGDGVYINSLGGLHAGANVISGDFSLQSAGFLVEGGKKTKPVKSFTVAGNFFDLLGKVVALADNLEVPNPTGITAFGSPSVLVEALSIAGK